MDAMKKIPTTTTTVPSFVAGAGRHPGGGHPCCMQERKRGGVTTLYTQGLGEWRDQSTKRQAAGQVCVCVRDCDSSSSFFSLFFACKTIKSPGLATNQTQHVDDGQVDHHRLLAGGFDPSAGSDRRSTSRRDSRCK